MAVQILDKLLSTPLGELLSWRAFDSDPGDVTVPLGKRFAGSQVVVLAMGSKQMKLGLVSFSTHGEPTIREVSEIGVKNGNALTEHLKASVKIDRKRGPTWVLLSVSNGWMAEFVSFGYHGPKRDRMRLLRDSPEDVVGKPLPIDHVHASISHPTMEASVIFSVASRSVLAIKESIENAGMRVAGVRTPHAAMLEAFCLGDPDGAQARPILSVDFQSALLMPVQNKEWRKPRYRSTAPTQLVADLAEFIRTMDLDLRDGLTVLGNPTLVEDLWKLVPRPDELVVPFDFEHPDLYAAALY